MKYLIAVVALLAFGVGSIYLFTSPELEVVAEKRIAAPTTQLYPYVNNLTKWPDWTVWETKERNFEGPEAGVGAAQSWTDTDDIKGRMEITESDPQSGIKYDLEFENFPKSYGAVEFASSQDGQGTIVRMKMKMTVGNNPVGRLMKGQIESYIKKDFSQSLDKLAGLAEDGSAVEESTNPQK